MERSRLVCPSLGENMYCIHKSVVWLRGKMFHCIMYRHTRTSLILGKRSDTIPLNSFKSSCRNFGTLASRIALRTINSCEKMICVCEWVGVGGWVSDVPHLTWGALSLCCQQQKWLFSLPSFQSRSDPGMNQITTYTCTYTRKNISGGARQAI